MYWCVLVCCLMWCDGVYTKLQCNNTPSTVLKLSIASQRNETGHWYAQVQLGHEAESKNAGPWEIDVDHVTTKCLKSESVLITATVTAPPSDQILKERLLSAGYELVPALGYYKFHTEPKTWQEALKTCEVEGAHLLVVNSEYEAYATKRFWEKAPRIVGGTHTDWAWIGFHDLYKEGEFVTVLNTTLASTGYVKWAGGEGTGGTSQNCGLIRNTLEFADYGCTSKDAFFCEYEL